MSLDIKALIITVAYAIIVNLVLISYANMGIGITCYETSDFDMNNTMNYSDVSDSNLREVRANIFNVLLNRCDGLPSWIFWVFEIPIIIGILYIIRGFIGAT